MDELPAVQSEIQRVVGKSLLETLEIDEGLMDLDDDLPGFVRESFTKNGRARIRIERREQRSGAKYLVLVFDETKNDGKTSAMYIKDYILDCKTFDNFTRAMQVRSAALKEFNERGY